MRNSWRALAALTILTLPACTVTWREPVLQPLNASRFYDDEITATCDAVEAVATRMGLTIKDTTRQERACLVETDFRVFSDAGDDPTEHLKRVAWTGVGRFIGGRYTTTITSRDVRDGGTRVRISTRIEGYISEEFGYQVLRSRGIIEDAMFAAIGVSLGTGPVEAS